MHRCHVCTIVLGWVAGTASSTLAQRPTDVRFDTPAPVMYSAVARSAPVIAGVSTDHAFRVWDARASRLSTTIDIGGRDVALTAMSSDGRLLLMADYARKVTLWSAATGRVEWELTLPRYLTAAAFSRDGRVLAIALGSPVQLYDVSTHQLLRELEPSKGTTAIVFSRDGNTIATTDGEGVRVHDARSGRVITTSEDFVGVPLAVDFSADGKRVVASGGDRTVVSIDAATGRTLRRSARLSDPVFYVETSPNGGEVAVVTLNADDPGRPAPVAFLDVATLASKSSWRAPAGALLPGATWTSDGRFVVATQTTGKLHLWTVR